MNDINNKYVGPVFDIIKDPTLTYQQQLLSLARYGENTVGQILMDEEYKEAYKKGILCDLGEGSAPYRPRYICPDYNVLMKKGSKFLNLEPPTDLLEATNALLIMYKNVPSITSFPVFLGRLDELLEPFVKKMDRKEAKKILKLFLIHIDSTLVDSFVHADIGPNDSITARLLLELTQEMQLAIPNLTLRYDEDITPDDLAIETIKCMLKTSKPSFANHKMFVKEWGEDYAIASCYNGLFIRGGGYTLPRMKMYELSLEAKDVKDFKENILPKYTEIMLRFMDNRIRFIVEESNFFKSNFLVKEGFITMDRFTGMFGVVGVAEGVNHLLNIEDPKKGFGNNEQADQLGMEIMQELEDLINKHQGLYCKETNYKYRLHAQVGIDSDGRQDSPGARIPIGSEPELMKHILHSCKFHKYFPTGIGDIFKFEDTWYNTPESLLDIIKGALKNDMRYFTGYLANNDVVRVTGYLVKKSELAKLDKGEASLNQVSMYGKGARDGANALDRRIEK